MFRGLIFLSSVICSDPEATSLKVNEQTVDADQDEVEKCWLRKGDGGKEYVSGYIAGSKYLQRAAVLMTWSALIVLRTVFL